MCAGSCRKDRRIFWRHRVCGVDFVQIDEQEVEECGVFYPRLHVRAEEEKEEIRGVRDADRHAGRSIRPSLSDGTLIVRNVTLPPGKEMGEGDKRIGRGS
eukprot:763573-Hanusia_phi.AAC.5